MTYSKLKHIRRLGVLPSLSKKEPKLRIKTPGQHGKLNTLKQNKSSLSDYYKDRLIEKQKLKINYNLSDSILYAYIKKAKKLAGNTGYNLLNLIESRLDNIVFRLGFATSIAHAKQIIAHKKIKLNNKIVTFPNIQCKIHDTISLTNASDIKNIFNTKGNFLKRINNFEGKIIKEISRNDILLPINELKIIEFYS